MERASTQQWNRYSFSALTNEDAFVLQVIHACHHFFTLWIRMSCLFEIAYFLNRRASDAELWGRVEERVGANGVLREFVVIVSEWRRGFFRFQFLRWFKSGAPTFVLHLEHGLSITGGVGRFVNCRSISSGCFPRLISLCFFASSIRTH